MSIASSSEARLSIPVRERDSVESSLRAKREEEAESIPEGVLGGQEVGVLTRKACLTLQRGRKKKQTAQREQ